MKSKSIKKPIALVLCLCLLLPLFSTFAGASKLNENITATAESRKNFGDRINTVIQTIVKGVCRLYPAPRSWKDISEYTGENIYDEKDGRQTYQTETAENAVWRVGYESASIIPGDFAKNKYYMGRQLNVVSFTEAAKCDGVLDDQRVRIICMDDSTGGGAVVMAVIDGIGMTSTTIREIRARLSDYVDSGKIAAINVSATHTHSAIDTQGVSTSMLYVMFANFTTNLFGLPKARTSNDPFIDNLISVTVEGIKKAYDAMEPGTLSYDSVDVSPYIRDKRGYIVGENLPDVGIVRFDPENEEHKSTYLVNMTCHPTNVNAGRGLVSADYPFYMDEMFRRSGYNFIMLQGAVGQISGNGSDIKGTGDYNKLCREFGYREKYGDEFVERLGVESADAFAEKMTEIILDASSDGEELLEPRLNTKYTYVGFTASNYTLHLAVRIRLVDNEVYRTGKGIDDFVLPSEVGLLELGGRLAFGLFPAELYPEVFHGEGIITEDKDNYSWDGTAWDIPSAAEMLGADRDVYAVSFANDYIGYVVPDNFYSGWGHWALKGSDRANYVYDPNESVFAYAFGGTADEILSADRNGASKIMNAFESLT